MEQFNDYNQPPKQRPTILTVFGILTFIGAGFGVLGALIGMVMPSGGFGTSMIESPPIYIHLLGLVIAGAKIFGVIQMFKLQKTGFFIYVGAEVLGLILTIINLKYSTAAFDSFPGLDNMASMVSILSIVFYVIFSGLWIGIYASQLKEME